MSLKLIAILLLSISTLFAQGWRDKEGNHIPDSNSTKSIGGFGAKLLSVNEKAFFKVWNRPSESVNINLISKVHRGDEVIFPIIFAGCKKDTNGTCKLTGYYNVFKPDNTPYGKSSNKMMTLFEGKPEDGYMLNLANNYLKITFEPKDKLGRYTIKAKVKDAIANKSMELSTTITLVDDNVTIKKEPIVKKYNKPKKPKLSKAQKELNEWINHGYKYPASDDEKRINALLQDELFFKKPSSLLILASFMIERFKQNDKYIIKNIPTYKKLKTKPLNTLIFALKMADTNATKKASDELLKEIKDKRFVEYIKNLKIIDSVDLKIDAPIKIDIHWAAFLATGKEIYVKKIIELLSLEEKGVKNITLLGSARWSLLSNCKQHPKVLKVCKEYKSSNPKVNRELKKLLKEVNN